MSREGIDNVRYEIQNWFIKEYTCHTETRIENEKKLFTNEFRKTDMTIAEIKEAIQIKEELKNERLSFDDVKTALKIHKTIKKLYNI